MMRKSLLDHVGGYDEQYKKAQDYDLWMRCAPFCQFANLPDVLMKKRFTTDMISYAQERKQLKAAVRIRFAALRREQFPWWCSLFLVKPFLATFFPPSLVRFLRANIFGQSLYKRVRT